VSRTPGASTRTAAGPRPDAPATYRPEIDGLRAVAVLGVIVHHLNTRLLPGGYLGVDIFFVISGFVITGSLARRPAASLADLMLGFYGRRIRRLLPAMLLCVVITAVALCLVNPEPGQMLGVGWRALFGSSNLILHRLAVDYFRSAAELNPFTHTWSLGVEEQFYLLFPLLVWFSGFARHGRAGHRRLRWLLLPLVVISFAVFLERLGVDEPAAYFLLPGRFWELGVGCLLFLLVVPADGAAASGRGRQADPLAVASGDDAGPAGSGLLPWALVALLGLVILMALPLRFGAVPVAAAVALTTLLLASLRPGGAAHALLSRPPLVFLGLISYALYLWHWSVLALARWTVGVNAATIPLLLALILLLAVLSWRFVEEPLRRSAWWPERWQVLATGLLLAGAGTATLQGLTRFGSAALFRGDAEAAVYRATPMPPGGCGSPPHRELLLAGDSHAHVFQAAAGPLCSRHGLGHREAATVGMPYPTLLYSNPATGMERDQARQYALVEQQRWDSMITARGPEPPPGDVVVLALRWPLYFDPGYLNDSSLRRTVHFNPDSDEPIGRREALERWIEAVGSLSAAHPRTPIVLLLPTPEFGGEVPMQLCQPQWFRPQLPPDCARGIDRRGLERFSSHLRRQLQPLLQRHPRLLLHDPINSLCPPQQGRCPRLRNGYLLYSDGDHLSSYGAELVLDDLVAALRRRGVLPGGAPVAPAAAVSAEASRP